MVFLCFILELFWRCGIFVFHFGTVLAVWYFCVSFWNCSDGVVFLSFILELVWRCGIFVFHSRTVLLVWYFCVSFYNCSDGVVYLSFILELFWWCGILEMFLRCGHFVTRSDSDGVFNLCQQFEISYSRYANKHMTTCVYIAINDNYR